MRLIASLVSTALIAVGAPKPPVSFNAPSDWRMIEKKHSVNKVYFLYEIGGAEKREVSEAPANGLVQYYTVSAGFDPARFDDVIASRIKNGTVIVCGIDGRGWKTYLLTTEQGGENLIVLYRIGIQSGVVAEVMVSFPATGSVGTEPLKILTIEETTVKGTSLAGVMCSATRVGEMVNSFNEICSSLRIKGRNVFSAKMKLVDPPRPN